MLKFIILLLIPLSSFAMNNDSSCMESAIFHESGNQSILGQIAVANVIQNRVKHKYWSNSICGVIKEKHQFSFYSDNKSDKVPNSSIKKVRLSIFLSNFVDITWNSLYYHADYVSPSWSKRLKKTIIIGNHIFYTQIK